VLQQGQGMHGGFGRDSTYNNMAAIGPDFTRRSLDTAPVSNADIAPTLAQVLGVELTKTVPLGGRVLAEALNAGRPAAVGLVRSLRSMPAENKQTVIFYQEFGGIRYLDKGCFVSPETHDEDACN
jgi:arylsulfatase A-like enzyme